MVRAFLAIRLRKFFFILRLLVVFVVYANFNTRAKSFSQIWWKSLSFPSCFNCLAQKKTFLRLKNALIESNITTQNDWEDGGIINFFVIFKQFVLFFLLILDFLSLLNIIQVSFIDQWNLFNAEIWVNG